MKLLNIRLLLVLVLFSMSCYLHSQVNQFYNAGYSLTNYVDIEPDTLINWINVIQGSTETYDIDITGDMVNDFRIEAEHVQSLGWSSRTIGIISLNPNSFALFGRYDSTYVWYTSSWWISRVAQPLIYADTINSSTSFWYNGYLTLTEISTKFGTSKLITDWVSPDDQYIGIKYLDSTDTIFGWLRVNIPTMNHCFVKDYSFSSFTTNIQETESVRFNIYPNPAIHKIFIERTNNEEMEVRLFDLLGRQFMGTTISKSKITEIDVSGIRRGTYILRLSSNDNSFNRKIVIE